MTKACRPTNVTFSRSTRSSYKRLSDSLRAELDKMLQEFEVAWQVVGPFHREFTGIDKQEYWEHWYKGRNHETFSRLDLKVKGN